MAVGVSCVGDGQGDFVFCFHNSFVLMFFILGEMEGGGIFGGLGGKTAENGGLGAGVEPPGMVADSMRK